MRGRPPFVSSGMIQALTRRTLLGALAACVARDRPVARPRFELRPGEHYFHVDGRAAFVLGRNPAGMNPQAFDRHFASAAAAGERFVRIHFTFLPETEQAGEVDAGMLYAWDAILDAAELRGLAVLPVLGVWADWNDGSAHEAWHAWDRNPFNQALGGPAARPGELFEDTFCRQLWMKRIETLVRRWSPRRAIVAWEIFSELDLVTGASEQRAVEFTRRAAGVIRAVDPMRRPVTASQAGMNEWPELLCDDALDFVAIHPYGGRLDDLILSGVRQRLRKYGKPVLIGESGLDAAAPRQTLDVAARAEFGVRHAVWAAMVSGAMNGRMLWWQDGYDVFEKVDLETSYREVAASAAAFVRDLDFAGFVPVDCAVSDGLKGAMIGNDRVRLGWFRDSTCEPPDWPVRSVEGQTLQMAGSWWIEFVDPVTNTAAGSQRMDGRMALPAFQDSIALRATALGACRAFCVDGLRAFCLYIPGREPRQRPPKRDPSNSRPTHCRRAPRGAHAWQHNPDADTEARKLPLATPEPVVF